MSGSFVGLGSLLGCHATIIKDWSWCGTENRHLSSVDFVLGEGNRVLEGLVTLFLDKVEWTGREEGGESGLLNLPTYLPGVKNVV